MRYPVWMVFRQYGDDGRPLPHGYVVDREAASEEEADSHTRELNALGYELESKVPVSRIDGH